MNNGDSHNENDDQEIELVRFFMGPKLLGQTRLVLGDTIVEHAESAGVNIPNCTSGTCGTCMITLLSRRRYHCLIFCRLAWTIIWLNKMLDWAVLEFLLAIVKSTFVRHYE